MKNMEDHHAEKRLKPDQNSQVTAAILLSQGTV